MRTNRLWAHEVALAVVLFLAPASWTQTHPRFRAVPPGVVELTGLGTDGGIIELNDGPLMLAQGAGVHDGMKGKVIYRISQNGGRNWDDPATLNSEIGVGGLIRLKSGAVGIYGRRNANDASPWEYFFSKSTDEGKTWSPGTLITNYPNYYPMHHSMVQLESGRLLVTGYWEGLNGSHPDTERYTRTGWGLWQKRILFMEGHRGVEMGICVTYYSDDEGKTWKQSQGGLFGWFDEKGEPNGAGGILDLYEPTSAETKDGRVLLIARSKTGRLVRSYSLNGGVTWHSAQPTELSSSQSPALLIRIPKTGDLLCVWNQVSAEEIRRGFLRGRLSAAISMDSGMTWRHFRTLELQDGMEEGDQIAPEFPIPRRLVARPGLGQLPDGFAMFTYPNVDIVGDKVFVRYSRMWPRVISGKAEIKRDPDLPLMWPKYEERETEMTGESILRIYPLKWFYR